MGSWALKLVRDELAKRVIGFILVALAVGAAFIYKKSLVEYSVTELVLIAVVILLATYVAANYLYRRISHRAYWYPSGGFNFEILEKEMIYRIQNGELLFSRRIKLRALGNNLEHYVDKFLWTGGATAIPTPVSGAREASKLGRAGIWKFYQTQFDRTLRRGAIHEFTVSWPPISDWSTSQPFVSSSTDEPTRLLIFNVDLSELGVDDAPIIKEELRAIESAYAFQTEESNFEHGRYVWKIQRPKLYRHFRLHWSWPGSSNPPVTPEQQP